MTRFTSIKIFISIFLLFNISYVFADEYVFAQPKSQTSGAKCYICIKGDDNNPHWCEVGQPCHIQSSDFTTCSEDQDVIMRSFRWQPSYFILNANNYTFVEDGEGYDFTQCTSV